ncbi:trace amine-associated receptor 6-like [Crassostrea angulata]|uniref:trace amine-associated receptor 6-like n=1 Tax=Magallana angulata TaxID=2784310 RepID=UPI0022B108B1|nr:trace amine-associated receptor 6-like [Crassostrea angulata]
MDVNVRISTQNEVENDSTSKGFTLQLWYNKTTFEITFTYVIFTIAFFGCMGNLATKVKIVYDPKYHTPTFAAIGQLALADFLSVTMQTFDNMTNSFGIRSKTLINTTAVSSFSHLCLLTIVRYLITVHPLQSRQHLTVTAVCLCSLTIWIYSSVFVAITNYTADTICWIYRQTLYLIVNFFILLIVCSIMTLLHVKKIRTLQNSLSVTEQSQRRMNIVVTVIISVFVFYRLSLIAIKIIYFFQFSAELYYHVRNLEYFYIFMTCINFSCNPYILFFSQFV